MARTHFTRELQRLQDDVLLMGSVVRQSLAEAVAALCARDLEAARRIVAADRDINARRLKIEDDCLALIAMQQPAAKDLRLLAGILEISARQAPAGAAGADRQPFHATAKGLESEAGNSFRMVCLLMAGRRLRPV